MGPHFEASLQSEGKFHQHDREGSLVDGSGFGSLQHAARFLRIRPVYDDGFETLAGDPAGGNARRRAMLVVTFLVAQNPSQDSDPLLVRPHYFSVHAPP